MEKQKKMYDGMSFDQKMEALDMLQAAMEQVETTKKAISHFIATLGIEPSEKKDCKEFGFEDLELFTILLFGRLIATLGIEPSEKKDCKEFGFEDLVEIVSDRLGICPHIVEVIMDTAMDVLDQYTGEGADDADEDN